MHNMWCKPPLGISLLRRLACSFLYPSLDSRGMYHSSPVSLVSHFLSPDEVLAFAETVIADPSPPPLLREAIVKKIPEFYEILS